jgi:nucleotide-binding universal stress UspA family protein
MSATAVLFALLFAWLLIGIVCSFVMARRGHDPWSWGVLGALFGPLIVPLALSAARRDRTTNPVVGTWHTGAPGGGPISVLVGVDGSPEAQAAACTAVELLGPRLGRLTLATVIDLDAAESARTVRSALSAEAQGVLEDPAGYVVDFDPDTVVLTGEPAHALLEYAQDKEADLLAVGTHGRGLSKAVLGSVAQRLVRQGDIPVLVVGTGMPVPRRLQHGAETHHSVRT